MINVLLTKLAISYASCLELICDLQVTEMCLTLFTVLCLLWGLNVLSLEIHCLLTPVFYYFVEVVLFLSLSLYLLSKSVFLSCCHQLMITPTICRFITGH